MLLQSMISIDEPCPLPPPFPPMVCRPGRPSAAAVETETRRKVLTVISRKRSSGSGRGASPKLPRWPIDLRTKVSCVPLEVTTALPTTCRCTCNQRRGTSSYILGRTIGCVGRRPCTRTRLIFSTFLPSTTTLCPFVATADPAVALLLLLLFDTPTMCLISFLAVTLYRPSFIFDVVLYLPLASRCARPDRSQGGRLPRRPDRGQ